MMRTVLRFALGLAAAVVAWAAAVRTLPFLAPVFDPFLILVVYHALRRRDSGRPTSALSSALAGSVAGLSHDVLTGGFLGIHGFADTLTGWAVTKVQQRMDLQQTVQIGLAGFLASGFQLATLASLQFFMVPTGDPPALGYMALRMVLTGALLVLVRLTADRAALFGAAWRERRRARLRFDV